MTTAPVLPLSFVPLHVHSQYSILDSTASIAALVAKARSYHVSSLALTDKGNLHGVVDFYKACKDAKITPIIGCEIWMAPGSRCEKKRIPGVAEGYPILLLCKNQAGGPQSLQVIVSGVPRRVLLPTSD